MKIDCENQAYAEIDTKQRAMRALAPPVAPLFETVVKKKFETSGSAVLTVYRFMRFTYCT